MKAATLLFSLIIVFPGVARASHILGKAEHIQIVSERAYDGDSLVQAVKQAGELSSLVEQQLLPDLLSFGWAPEIRERLLHLRLNVTVRPKAQVDEKFEVLSDQKTLSITIWDSLLLGEDVKGLFVHAFFHAVHYLIHPGEPRWVREGLALVYEKRILNRFNGAAVAALFDGAESPPLEEDSGLERISFAHYGHVLFYFYYLLRECSDHARAKTELIWELTQGVGSAYGRSGIDEVLKRYQKRTHNSKPQCQSFIESARSFEIARFANRKNPEDQNPSRYFLWSTTLRRASPLSSVTPRQINELHDLEPLILDGKVGLSTEALPLGLWTYWIHDEFPYEVVGQAPLEPAGWRQLVLKY